MAQAVSRRPLTTEARVRSRFSPCGICGGQRGTGTGFFPSTLVFPCQFHSTGAPLQGKTKKLIIIFITVLHSKRQGCGASVASAAGPFAKKKKNQRCMKLNSELGYSLTQLIVKESKYVLKCMSLKSTTFWACLMIKASGSATQFLCRKLNPATTTTDLCHSP
jgi:hypothetical protein